MKYVEIRPSFKNSSRRIMASLFFFAFMSALLILPATDTEPTRISSGDTYLEIDQSFDSQEIVKVGKSFGHGVQPN